MGGQGQPPEIMAREGVDVMICRGLGRRAISLFKELGIDVYIGAFGTVKDAIDDFQQGRLQKAGMSDACGQHAFRDQHHHEHHSGNCH
jgi:predicted Fe-Mo cluster-binding NifX family protein